MLGRGHAPGNGYSSGTRSGLYQGPSRGGPEGPGTDPSPRLPFAAIREKLAGGVGC